MIHSIKRTLYKLLPLAIVLSFVLACTPAPPLSQATENSSKSKVVTLFIAPQKVDCIGVAARRCLQVKQLGETDFSPFYDTIEGFNHQEGSEYTLLVKVESIPNPTNDRSTLSHSLIKVMKPSSNPNTKQLELGSNPWKLRSFINPANNLIPVSSKFNASIDFRNGKLSGNGGCNQFFGNYRKTGSDTLELQISGSTMMACLEPVMTLENAYFAALEKTITFRIFENQLELLGTDQTVVAAYLADANLDLTGPTWKLLSYNNGSTLVSNETTTLITAHFSSKGRLSGFSGCNRYFAGYQSNDNDLDFEFPVTTRKSCKMPIGVMSTENSYLGMLSQVSAYSIRGNRLTFHGSKRSRLAVFKTDYKQP